MPAAAVSVVVNGDGPPRKAKPREAEKDGARTVGRVLRLFELLASGDEALRLTDISRELKVPLSSAHALIHQLIKLNYVGVVEDRRYAKGPGLMRLGSRILSGIDLIKVGYPVLQRLSITTGESVYLGMRHANGIAYVRSVEATSGIVLRAPLGVPRPLHASSVGKIFLAYGVLPSQLDAMLGPEPLHAYTSKTVTDRAVLRRVLDEIRNAGFSLSEQEIFDRAIGLSVPVFAADSTLAGAITLGADIGRFRKSRDVILGGVIAAAAEISRYMGVENWSQVVEAFRGQPAFSIELPERTKSRAKTRRAKEGSQ